MSSDNRHLAMGAQSNWGVTICFCFLIIEGIDKEKIHKCQVNRCNAVCRWVPSSPLPVYALRRSYLRYLQERSPSLSHVYRILCMYNLVVILFFLLTALRHIFHTVECRTKSLIYNIIHRHCAHSPPPPTRELSGFIWEGGGV